MREELFKKLLDSKSMTLSEYARTFLGVKYSPSVEPMILATLAMDDRFEVKEGRIRLTKTAEANSFNKPFIVLDTETTGLTSYDNYVVEVAALKIEGSHIVDRFHTLVRPHKSIPPIATSIHKITNEMVADKPFFADIMDDLLEFIGDGIFVAHNVLFDWRFVNDELKRNGKGPLSNSKMCTIQIAKTVLPNLSSYKLESLTKHFNTKALNTHRAMDDVSATVEILLEMLPKLTKPQLKRLIF